ncbi:hypothetical protein M5K25_011792 [Dendrobium thyrsiflorum]|uniref:HAT C-terminal dimerisation domain-containing protein n=1 Tax=Dendrobium thyrsiflorum TaxID=117978 RepID=A0ABD0V3T0_DENTH
MRRTPHHLRGAPQRRNCTILGEVYVEFWVRNWSTYSQVQTKSFAMVLWTNIWWIQFGDSTPELQSFVVRVLGLNCSSSGCERNWSTYSQVQTKRRNRLSTLRMNSLEIEEQGLKDDEDPLVCEDVASDNEWFIDDETDLSLSDLQLEDLSVDVLRGEADQGGTSTSTTPHTSTSSAAQQANKGKRKVDNIEDDEDFTFIDTIGEEDSLEDLFSDGT